MSGVACHQQVDVVHLLCIVAACSQFLGGDAAGYAAAMLVSAFPLVGVALGMLHFNEFTHASRAARTLVLAEVAFYLSAVGLLAASASGSGRSN